MYDPDAIENTLQNVYNRLWIDKGENPSYDYMVHLQSMISHPDVKLPVAKSKVLLFIHDRLLQIYGEDCESFFMKRLMDYAARLSVQETLERLGNENG